VATRSKMSLTNELRMLMARLEIPVSGWTCLRTADASATVVGARQRRKLTLVDVAGVGLLPGLGALLLVARGSGCLLASLLLLGGRLAGRGLAAGGGSLLGLGRHFGGDGDGWEKVVQVGEMEELVVGGLCAGEAGGAMDGDC
jgi:hypothetical protein